MKIITHIQNNNTILKQNFLINQPTMSQLFILYETASGYALFEGLDLDEIGQTSEAVQATIT